MRQEPSDKGEMVNQVLYGEIFKIPERRAKWSRIRLSHDKYEGWVDNKQFVEISEEQYNMAFAKSPQLAGDLLQMVTCSDDNIMSIPMGSCVSHQEILEDHFEGNILGTPKDKSEFINTALLYLKSPYLWGGRTPFGIDCSGFTQMVYRLNGHKLLRDASQQATQGEALSFIEESEPGDLAFFDNSEGDITHVGLIMQDNYIIHAHGEVRIDRLDHSGIYNAERRMHTHKLRVIKKVI